MFDDSKESNQFVIHKLSEMQFGSKERKKTKENKQKISIFLEILCCNFLKTSFI